MFPDEARLGNVGDFFEAPVVNRSWKTETTDPQLVRFGLFWKVDDWLALKGLYFQVPILESSNRTCVYFRGGVSGTEFLVEASGLDQPRASRGLCILQGITPLWPSDIRVELFLSKTRARATHSILSEVR